MSHPHAELPHDRTSPMMAVTGFLMLLSPLLAANPWSGQQAMWPWEIFDLGLAGAYAQTEIAIWSLAGLWALVMAFLPFARVRAAVATGMALLLVLHTSRADSGIPVVRFYLNDMVGLIGLGAGYLIALRPGGLRLGRLLCGVSAVALVWAFLVGFTGDQVTPRYVLLLDNFQAAFTGAEYSDSRFAYLWYYVLPQIVLLSSGVLGLLVAFGLTKRRFVAISFIVMLVAMAAPLAVRLVGALSGADPEATRVGGALFVGLVQDGLLAWLFAAVSLADLVPPAQEAP